MSKISDIDERWLQDCAHAKLVGKLLHKDSVVVFSNDLEQVLWSNYSGASLFAGKGIAEFLNDGIAKDHPFSRQLSIAVEQLGNDSIYRGFRVVDQGKSKLLQCKISRVKRVGKVKKCILLKCSNISLDSEHEIDIANATITSLSSVHTTIAITDELGLPISASSEFLQAEISPESLRAVCGRDNISAQYPDIELQDEDEKNTAAKIYPIALNPKRFFIILDETQQESAEDPEAVNEQTDGDTAIDEPRHENNTGNLIVGGALITGAALANENLVEESLASGNNEAAVETDESPEVIDPETNISSEIEAESETEIVDPAPSEKVISKTEKRKNKKRKSKKKNKLRKREKEKLRIALASESEPDQTEENAPVEYADKAQEIVTEQIVESNEEFTFDANAQAVQFRWSCDDAQTFTYLSDELSHAVGPIAADVIDRKWSDIAQVFGFDSNGSIQALLEKQDTWSGKSVLWPVQGTDLQIPIDLAALPSFGSGRNFTGFSGFGIARVGDAVVDPEAMGLALTPGPRQNEEPEEETHGRIEIQYDEAEDQPTENTSNDPIEPPKGDNIISLASPDGKIGAQDQRSSNELSTGENRAFDEIGRKLKSITNPEFGRRKNPPSTENSTQSDNLSIEVAQNSEKSQDNSPIVDTSILAKLPVPVIVYRDNETLFANHELLQMSGYESLEQLREAGGVKRLFDDTDNDPINDGRETVLRDSEGNRLKVQALLQSVPWDKERALLLSFRQPRHENLPNNEKIVLDMMRVSELQNILDTATDGIIILNQDGQIDSINPSAEALFGKPMDDVANSSITELFSSESHEKITNHIANIDNPDENLNHPNGLEVIGVEAKGGLIPLFMTIGNIGSEGNKCAILRDMTHWKKTREELVSAKKAAENASDQKTEFLARISHEIRTPLNAIIGFSDVMIEEQFGPVENERYREYLRDINRSGIHVLDLINDLLDISKIEAGKMEISFEAVGLNDIVSETVALLQPQANGRRVLIRTSLSRAVPKVVADARSIRQIVLNLVSNAIKFTSANGQVIVSTVYEGNGEVALRVRDSGKGMSESEIKTALKPFQQINSISDNQSKGTGLGLPLTKALVEANKAFFEIESERGKGTIVHVQFPTQRVLAD